MQQLLDGHGSFQVVDCQSQIGSGALPAEGLPSRAVQVAPKPGGGRGVKRWSDALRALPIPVIGRISDNHLLLDMRTLDDCDAFVSQLEVLAGRLDSTAGPVQP